MCKYWLHFKNEIKDVDIDFYYYSNIIPIMPIKIGSTTFPNKILGGGQNNVDTFDIKCFLEYKINNRWSVWILGKWKAWLFLHIFLKN